MTLPVIILALCIGCLQAMHLPLVYPISGFTKADEFLLTTRAALRDSPFHVYVGDRRQPAMQLRRLFSLSESTYRLCIVVRRNIMG